jgi:3-methyladenine DNA glycosylase AlkD
MPPKKKSAPAKSTKVAKSVKAIESTKAIGKAARSRTLLSLEDEVKSVLAWLERHSSKSTRDGMARFAIPSDKAFGVTMSSMKVLAGQLGKHHELAAALWDIDRYETRTLAALIDEPARVTPAQMDRWCRDFDNWAICDTACFALFDRTPHAWQKVAQWHDRREEYIKRAAFALLWGLTVHDKQADDARFVEGLSFIERAATDERHFVKKAINMALRAIGKRNPALNEAARAVARRLADSPQAAPRWVGKDALRELTSASVNRRLAAPRRTTSAPPATRAR